MATGGVSHKASESARKALKPKRGSTGRKWRRADEDREATEEFGAKLKSLRLERGLSLVSVAANTGVSAATLSRIENNKMTATHAVLIRILEYFRLEWNELMPSAKDAPSPSLMSLSNAKRSLKIDVPTARRIYPHGQGGERPLNPVIVEISPTRPDDFELFGHRGTELCYVLAGTLRFHAKGRRPRNIVAGESILFDSRTPHAYTSAGDSPVRLLIVSTWAAETKPAGGIATL
jgi:transcriptional regulator with XRE-family HTH domain